MSEPETEETVHRLIRLIDGNKKDLFKTFDPYEGWAMTSQLLVLSFLVALIWIFLFLRALGSIPEVAVAVGTLAFVVGYFRLLAPFLEENMLEANFRRLVKKEKPRESEKPLLKALLKMKAENREFDLETVYNIDPSVFSAQKLVEYLYE